jgi:3-hydroxyisobutyrate dehydrogenase
MVLLCLPTSEHVRSVVLGEHGLAAALRPGSLIIDQTSGDPTLTRQMAAQLAPTGVELIDAPVSGGLRGAHNGTIAIMVGASTAQYERVLPVLQDISPNIFHAGDVGTGHVAKLCNNLLSGGQRLLSLEAVALAVKSGLTPHRAVDIIAASSGRNVFVESFLKPHVVHGRLHSGFTLGLLHKDVRLACKLGDDAGVSMPFGNLVKSFYQAAINERGEHDQVNSVALIIDRLAGTHVVPPDYTLE